MHVHELPPEIWALISSHLSRAELLPLCLASSTLLAVIRPIYYRFVTLHRDHRAWTALSLLARDKGLAERVVKLQLIGSTKRRRCWTIVHPHGFTNLISLGHLVLTGRLFDDASEELQFWHLIKNKPGVPIKVLAYKLKADYDDVTSTHNPLDGLGGFTKLSWDNRGREQCESLTRFPPCPLTYLHQ